MNNSNFLPINAVTDATNQTSAKIDARGLVAYSLVATFSDTDAAGAVKVQGSNEPSGSASGGTVADFTPATGSWVDVASATATVVAGAAVTVSVTQNTYRWLRIVFTRTGGSGLITVAFNGLGF